MNEQHSSRSQSAEKNRLQEVLNRMRGQYVKAGRLRALVVILVAAAFVITLDCFFGLASSLRWLAWFGILFAALGLFWHWRKNAGRIQEFEAVEAIEKSFPEVGQLPRTARDLQANKLGPESGVSPRMKSDVLSRAQRFWMGVSPEAGVDTRVTKGWTRYLAGAAVGFVVLFLMWGDFRTATARLVWPSSQLSFTRLQDLSPEQTYKSEDSFRFHVEAKGREPEAVKVRWRTRSGEEHEQTLERGKNGDFAGSALMPPGGFEYSLVGGDDELDWKAVECRDPARLLSSQGVVIPPDYTGFEKEEFESGDVEGWEGSEVELSFEMTVPMKSAKLVFEDGQEVEADCEDREISLTTEIIAGKRVYDLVGLDEKGREIDATKFLMDGRADQMPKIEIVEPRKEVAATPVGEVPVRIRARDDVGLGEVGIILEAQGEQRELLNLPIAEDGSLEIKELALAALEEFPLSINDNVRLFAYAKDKKPRGEARAVSEMRAIDIQQFQTRWFMKPPGEGEP